MWNRRKENELKRTSRVNCTEVDETLDFMRNMQIFEIVVKSTIHKTYNIAATSQEDAQDHAIKKMRERCFMCIDADDVDTEIVTCTEYGESEHED